MIVLTLTQAHTETKTTPTKKLRGKKFKWIGKQTQLELPSDFAIRYCTGINHSCSTLVLVLILLFNNSF
jgi:hypothetical protein